MTDSVESKRKNERAWPCGGVKKKRKKNGGE
jgi:hypothetical protein